MVDVVGAIGWPVLDRIRVGDAFAVSPHGIGIAVGFLAGAWLLQREGPKRGLRPDHISTMVFWAIVGTILGARFFYVVAHYSEFDGLFDMLAIWRGGISLLGGIAGAIMINLPMMRRYGYRFFQVMDPAMLALAFGIPIGRIGDLVIGDHLGKPTSWALAFTYEGGTLAPPLACANGVCEGVLQDGQVLTITREAATLTATDGRLIAEGVGVHQTALYDLIGASLLFLLLWWLNRSPRREGILTLTFALWYGTMRLITDFLRVDKRFFGMTGSQWSAITAAIIAAVILIAWAAASRSGPAREEEGEAAAPAAEP